MNGKDKEDRLAIILTRNNMEELLAVPIIDSSTGASQAAAVFSVLQERSETQTVQAACFDTTASNTG